VNMRLADINNPFNRYTMLLSSNYVQLQWLQKVHLIAHKMNCDRCSAVCRLSAPDKSIDGFAWRCQKSHEISIRKHSFFSKSHTYIPDILNFTITYSEGQSLWKCAKTARITTLTLRQHTLRPHAFNFIRPLYN